MRRHVTLWATVALVLALVGNAYAEADVREVGSLGDDYRATLTIYRASTGQVGVALLYERTPYISVMSAAQAQRLATLLEVAWQRRNDGASDEIVGDVRGNKTVYVAVMREGDYPRVALSVRDGLGGSSFWSEAGQIRYLAATLRRAAR